jgi:hypothetical protein
MIGQRFGFGGGDPDCSVTDCGPGRPGQLLVNRWTGSSRVPDHRRDREDHCIFAHNLQPGWFNKPITVGIRDPIDLAEKNKVAFEIWPGGDGSYAERRFYLPW